MTDFIPYQVDYSVKNAAKTLGFSKKRVSFKFGFASPQALQAGEVGPACRGSEHELTFVWSLKTGKRQLLLDNKDLHFSESGQNGWTADRAWQHAFTLKDHATRKAFRVHFISQPCVKEVPDSRPFDLKVGGMSYFQFNLLYQLGTPAMVSGHQPKRGHRGSVGRESPIMSPEERQAVAAAKLASLQDLRQNDTRAVEDAAPSQSMNRIEDALISFDDPPPPQQPVTEAAATNSNNPNNYFGSSITLDASIEENKPAPAAPFGANPYAAAPPPAGPYPTPYTNNPYAAAPATTYSGTPYAPAPSPYATTSAPYNVPSPYGNPSPAPANSNALTTYQAPAPQPYVDATGRMSMGQQQPGSSSSFNYSTSTMTSPGNVSYGSAPSFAQPPPQPNFAQPPPQQQPPPPQYSSGFPPPSPSSQPPPSYFNPAY